MKTLPVDFATKFSVLYVETVPSEHTGLHRKVF